MEDQFKMADGGRKSLIIILPATLESRVRNGSAYEGGVGTVFEGRPREVTQNDSFPPRQNGLSGRR